MAREASILKMFGGFFKFLGFFFKFKFTLLFTTFIIINSIIIAIKTDNPQFIIDDLGSKALTPTLELQREAQKINSQGYFFSDQQPFFTEWYELWGLFLQFWFIWIEISVLSFLLRKVVLWDDSKGGVSIVLAVFIFFILQMLLLASKDMSIWQPWNAFKDIFIAVPYIVQPITESLKELFNKE